MKKSLLLVAFLHCICLIAQNKVAQKVAELQGLNAEFKSISVLSPTQNTINTEVDKTVNNATLATINTVNVNDIVANQYDYIELAVPYQNNIISLLLYKVNPFAEGFHLDTDKGNNVAYQKGVYYRGIIKGEAHSVASFNFFNGECDGLFSSNALGNVVVGKLHKTNNQSDYIVYSDAKMNILNQFECHVKEGTFKPDNKNNTNRNTLSDRCVTIYFEIDNNLFQANGNDVTTTTNWMTAVFNNVQTLYNNDGITVSLKSIYVWTTADPYQGVGTTSSAYLTAFHQNTPFFDGDVGQLVGMDPGGLGGVAVAIDGLCTQGNYSYSDIDGISYATVPTYSWTVQVITHELGHLLGSPHTHGCYWNGNQTTIDGCGQQAGYSEGTCIQGPIPSTTEKGTIMSYCHLINGVGINLANGFGAQPAARILDAVNNATCLSTDCTSNCLSYVSDLSTYNTTSTSISFSWSDASANTTWEVSVTPFASTNIVWTTVTNTDYTVNGLNPNTYYTIRVRPLCTSSSVVPTSTDLTFATNSTNLCNFSFTDTGGTSGNYTDMETWARTMIPTGAGLKIKVVFTAFSLESGFDYLYIYNGTSEFFPTLTPTGLTGNTTPSSYTSTATSGALTFKFVSDQGVVDTGWTATISCTGTLGIENNDYLDFSYYPNPTNGKVAITSKDAITEITVYNVAGQLLYSQKMNELTTNVDMSSFASGTYFFKLKFNDKEANFKILKM